jgi:Rad3-related DNA helicase
MKRLQFDSEGRILSVDGGDVDIKFESPIEPVVSFESVDENNDDWSLYEGQNKLCPLEFSNKKTQKDIVNEIVKSIKEGHKIIFLQGMCGTGKSAIALNIARQLGKASIVVPIKGLQRQYEEDYSGRKFVYKKDGKKMKISMITGRENHDSIIEPGKSCNDPNLPDTIMITEKNRSKLQDFYKQNPFIKNKSEMGIKQMKRISIAPANPYWSPIVPAELTLPLDDAVKKRYKGLNGKEFVFYHRKKGCGYYDQYQAYIDSDVIIFNSAKYKIEVLLNRKPETAVDIIDEADEFLDSFSNQQDMNLTKLINSLNNITLSDYDDTVDLEKMIDLLKSDEKNRRLLGFDSEEIIKLVDTSMIKAFKMLIKNKNIKSEIIMDELSYANKGLEIASDFEEFFDSTYLSYREDGGDIYVSFVAVDLSKKFNEIVDKSNALVLMTGTLHSEEVLKHVYGLKDFKIIEAETIGQGTIEMIRTGKEMDCRYSNFAANPENRKNYLNSLSLCISKAKKPILIQVNAFEDLPSEQEKKDYWLLSLMTKEKLKELQSEDKTGNMISEFKAKKKEMLFTTKCSRGVDFPGDTCNSVVFTKYPNPNINGTFWKILKQTHPTYFWEFYKDKARREFLQRLYRAVRSKNDHVFVLSPDTRVLDAVREIQLKAIK